MRNIKNFILRKFFRRDMLVWIAILLLAAFLRFYGLDLNPVGITHDDELHEIINAKSLAFTGSNIPGVVTGILSKNDNCIFGDCIYGELESYILIPWMRFFSLGLVLSKIPFVLGSLLLGSFFSILASLFYFGAKSVLPLIVFWGFAYNLYQFRLRHIKFTILSALVVLFVIGSYFLILSNSFAGKRFAEMEISQQSLRIERYLGFFPPRLYF